VTIRAKLYAAIVLTILGPLATTAVALHGMAEMGDRFDQVAERGDDEAVARELKFMVTDMNGWQTAYGYAGGDLRDRFVASAAGLRHELEIAADQLTDPQEEPLLGRLTRQFEAFMKLDAVAWHALQTDDPAKTKRILLGPELRLFEGMAATAEDLASYEGDAAVTTRAAFDDARDEARRRLIAVGLGAAVVIILLLVTANDIARLALEGERSARDRRPPETPSDGSS